MKKSTNKIIITIQSKLQSRKSIWLTLLHILFIATSSQAQNVTYGSNNSILGVRNVAFGYSMGSGSSSSNNSIFGYAAANVMRSGVNNSLFGAYAGRYLNDGVHNTFIGAYSGYQNIDGYNNVFIGYQAGYNETGSNKLYIDNSSTSSPLIWGNFSSNVVNINGKLGIGITNPVAKLDIRSTGTLGGKYDESKAYFKIGDGNVNMIMDGNEITGNGSIFIASGANPGQDIYFRNVDTNGSEDLMIIKAEGNVGIGTLSPTEKLEIDGKIKTTGIVGLDLNGGGIVGNNFNVTGVNELKIHDEGEGINFHDQGRIFIVDDATDDKFYIGPGKVGIGTETPEEQLDVNGKIKALGLIGLDQENGGISGYNFNISGVNELKIQDEGEGINFHDKGEIKIIDDDTDDKFYIGPGKVGIGTTDIKAKLDIRSSGTLAGKYDETKAYFRIGDGTYDMLMDGNEIIGNSSLYIASGASPGQDIYFRNVDTNGAENLMIIKTEGQVGIGTDTPSEQLHVVGNIKASGTLSASGYNPGDWDDAHDWGDHSVEGYWKQGNNISVKNITSTAKGTTTIGASSSAGFEFNSTLPMFYFNKPVQVDGGQIGSYNEDLQLQSSGVTEITISNTHNLVTVDADMVLNGQLKLNPTNGIPNDNNFEDLLVVNGNGEMATRTVESIESPWLFEEIITGQDTLLVICPDSLVIGQVLVDVIDLNGNVKIGDAAYIDDDFQAGDNGPGYTTPDDWIKFTEEGYLGFKSADATRGMLLFDDDTQAQYLNLFHNGGTSSLSNGSNDFFLQSTGRDVTFGGSVTIPNLAADRLEANDNMVFNFDRLHDVGVDHFQIERGGDGGLGLPVPLFKVEDTGNTSVLAGNFTVSDGHIILTNSPTEDASLTQVIVRDPAAGQLKYRDADSFTPWTNNSTYLSYTGKVGINTSSEPTTDLEVNGSGKFNSLEVDGKGNANLWHDAYTQRVNAAAGLTWNSTSKDLSVNIGSGLSINGTNQLEVDVSTISIPATQVTGLPWDTSGGVLTYTGNAKVTSVFEAQNLKLTGLGVGDKDLDKVMVVSSNGTVKSVLSSEFDTGVNSPWTISAGQLDYTGTVDVDGALESGSINTGTGTFTNVTTSTININGLISGSTFNRVLMEDGSGNLGYKDLSSFNFSHWDKDASDNLKYESGTITSTKGIYSEVSNSDLALVVKSAGTTNFKVDGGGNIRARKLELDLQTSWPDYVFREGYELRTLEEVENYVKENHHLPDVPSEQEIQENGIDVAEMESVLLQKIEELTLYIIDQNKTIKSQQEKLSEQNQELKQQKDDFAARLEALEQKIGQ